MKKLFLVMMVAFVTTSVFAQQANQAPKPAATSAPEKGKGEKHRHHHKGEHKGEHKGMGHGK
jgi:uncharacterized protein YdeI (BOF family)